ncbi:hypothetical protein [Desulfonema magnum]|uniref:Transposase n=1 Tax=Desulfonema magnum TaxID=45655 RepID=A0A975BF01_9BACT|nr:hypothetical protein [Desulfonema magnum]QTA84065.1 Uncharacterized protein dnm_000570 [Desulfonema magnum]
MKTEKKKKNDDDYDSPWKDILGIYFEEFMRFFFPWVADKIDWSRGYTLLDKELKQITREAERGKRLADRLVQVWKKDGGEAWVLAHPEIQAGREKDFPHRVWVYYYRIHDLYNRPVLSLAVLADRNPKWRPSEYSLDLWGCRNEFHFPVVKILDYKKQWEELEKSDSPFAVVVMAHLKTQETAKDKESRRRWKLELTKSLYRQGFEKQDIINLYRFIDWLMALPKELEKTYHEELVKFEEERKMQYVTTAERIGIQKGEKIGIQKGEKIGIQKGEKIGIQKGEKIGIQKGEKIGIQKGIKKGRKEGVLIGEILTLQRILKQPVYSKAELEKKTLKELKSILAETEARLPSS